MTKKRIATIAVLSPFLLAMALVFLFVSSVGYALNGRWELKTTIKDYLIKTA